MGFVVSMVDGTEDTAQFNAVYEQVFPVLIKVVYHIVGSMDVAEDICQEAFIRFYKSSAHFSSEDDKRYWLIRVAKNLSFNYYKRRERESRAVVKLENESRTFDDGGIDAVFKSETEQIVRKALDAVPPKLRSVLILKEYGGLTYREISKILHISENNVKIRAFRARNILEKMIDREDVYVL